MWEIYYESLYRHGEIITRIILIYYIKQKCNIKLLYIN